MVSKSFNPKVSIIIPVYNGSNYVREAIDSALAQTYKNIEILVINDGSNDNGETEKICKAYNKKIQYYKKENGGVASALNYGIEKMHGEYFSWLSHDDMYYPEKIEKQIKILSNLDDKETIVYSQVEVVDQQGKHKSFLDCGKLFTKEELDRPLFAFFHLALNGCAMLIHKSHFSRVGVFNTELPTTQDYDLWFRILRQSKIAFENSFLVKSRSHPNQESKALMEGHIRECNSFWIKVFTTITEKEIIETGGTKENFYQSLYNSFNSLTLYNEVISYLLAETLELLVKDFFSEENAQKKQIIDKIESVIYSKNCRGKGIIPKLLSYGEKRKTRIVFFTVNWHDRGGLNRVIAKISSLLSSTYDIFVLCIKEEGNKYGYPLDKKVKFLEIEPSEFLTIPSLMKILDVDIFIGSNNCYAPLITMYPEMRHMDIKVIAWNHEHYFLPYYENYLNQVALDRNEIFRQLNVVLWPTKSSAKIYQFFGTNSGVMPNPLCISSQSKHLKGKELNIISVGRFNSPQKRLGLLLIVFAKVLKNFPKAKLTIVGKYDLNMPTEYLNGKTISELIESLKLPQDRYTFIGEVTNVEKYYSKSLINIMTSEREGFGLTVIEAGLFSIPSVVFGKSGMEDIISDGVNGFVVEDGNVNEMAKRIMQLFSDTDLYKKMSKSSFIMSQNYSEDVIKMKWKNLIDGMMKLSSDKFAEFVKNNFFGDIKGIPYKEAQNIISMYEDTLKNRTREFLKNKKKIDEIFSDKGVVAEMTDSFSWKITSPLRKIGHLFELFKTQGLLITFRNIILKILMK